MSDRNSEALDSILRTTGAHCHVPSRLKLAAVLFGSETDRRDALHTDELQRRQDGFDHELDNIREALETRDLIGQAKGIIMGSVRCTAEEAFLLLRKQPQAENRKLSDVADEITARTQRLH